jgi:hypothetical protein
MRNIRFIPLLLVGLLFLAIPAAAPAQVAVGISVHIGPPAIPVYAQPICPGPGYLWTPGYWAYDDAGGYYWVPGTWVLAPVGMLWTPGYWGFAGGLYVWHAGYWGPHVGFYGGINYGFGYYGVGFGGGMWVGGAFRYNTAVANVNVNVIHNTYVDKTVIVNNNNHVAFNGGPGGTRAVETAQERSFASEPHTAPLAAQTEQERLASQNKGQFYNNNHGSPAVAGTARSGSFRGAGVVAAHGAPGGGNNFSDRPPASRPANNAGNTRPAGGSNTPPSNNRVNTPPPNNKTNTPPPNNKGAQSNAGNKGPNNPPPPKNNTKNTNNTKNNKNNGKNGKDGGGSDKNGGRN